MSLFSVSPYYFALQSIILSSDTLCSAGEPKQAWLYLGACQEQENFRSVPLDDELSVTTSRKCSKILTQNDSDINDGSGDHSGNQTSRMATLREEKRKTKRQNMINVNMKSLENRVWMAFPKATSNLGFQASQQMQQFSSS